MAQVNSYNVANRSGAQVREDINDIFDAIKTCNSGSSDPASPAKFMLYGDSASGDDNLRIYDGVSQFRPIGKVTEDNLGLLPRSGGTMTGPLLIDDSSSESTPALSFDTNTDLGLFRKGANQMGFSSSGTEQLFMDGNGLTLNNQKSLRFSEPTSAGSQYVEVKAPATLASNLTLTLPSTTPTAESTVSAGAGLALIAIDESGALGWGTAGGGAEGGGNDEIFWENDQTVTQNYEITNGKNAGSFGPIEIQGGVTVTVGAGESWTIV
tara:strand:- start:22 stop:822 length:801 start_codon:yes stop_codon:yes gene_type:complete